MLTVNKGKFLPWVQTVEAEAGAGVPWIVRSVLIAFPIEMHLTEESHVGVSGFLTFGHLFSLFVILLWVINEEIYSFTLTVIKPDLFIIVSMDYLNLLTSNIFFLLQPRQSLQELQTARPLC